MMTHSLLKFLFPIWNRQGKLRTYNKCHPLCGAARVRRKISQRRSTLNKPNTRRQQKPRALWRITSRFLRFQEHGDGSSTNYRNRNEPTRNTTADVQSKHSIMRIFLYISRVGCFCFWDESTRARRCERWQDRQWCWVCVWLTKLRGVNFWFGLALITHSQSNACTFFLPARGIIIGVIWNPLQIHFITIIREKSSCSRNKISFPKILCETRLDMATIFKYVRN